MPRKNLISLHEAVAIALLEQPMRTASFEQIADFIQKRGLASIRKGGITLEKQIMLRTTKSRKVQAHLFEEIGAGYIRLRDTHADFPLQLYNGLEALLEHDKEFYNPDIKELSVVDKRYGTKQTVKLKISPSDIICILSQEKSRRKNIYIIEKQSGSIGIVEFNNNKFNFESLCKHLDPINNYLVLVSKSSIVNVAFFDLRKKNTLQFSQKVDNINISEIHVPAQKTTDMLLNNFRIIKDAYSRRRLLQKTILGYKTDMGFL